MTPWSQIFTDNKGQKNDHRSWQIRREKKNDHRSSQIRREKEKRKKKREENFHLVWRRRHAQGKRQTDLQDVDEERNDEDEEQ